MPRFDAGLARARQRARVEEQTSPTSAPDFAPAYRVSTLSTFAATPPLFVRAIPRALHHPAARQIPGRAAVGPVVVAIVTDLGARPVGGDRHGPIVEAAIFPRPAPTQHRPAFGLGIP